MNVLGLDVSTSIVGVAIVNEKKEHILLDHINTGKMKDFWSKVDLVGEYIKNINVPIDHIYIEEPVMGYQSGKSSAQTIFALVRFNATVALLARQRFVTPVFIVSSHARKLCGIKTQTKKNCGLSHKEQTFIAVCNSYLKNVEWQNKRNKDVPVEWARDIVDAYVVALAGVIEISNQNK